MALVATVDRCVFCDFSGVEVEARGDAESYSKYLLTDSGTSALALAIADAVANCESNSKPEVIIPAYCCPDVLTAVRFNSARPVLVDLEPGTPWLALKGVAAALSDNTVAVVAVNFLGIGERLAQLAKLIDGHQCFLIDDACQSPPALDDLPGFADYRIHSFGRGKPVTLLHGGAVSGILDTDDARMRLEQGPESRGQLAEQLRCRMFNLARHAWIFGIVFSLGLAGRTRYAEPVAPGVMSRHSASVLDAAIRAQGQRRNSVASLLDSKLRSAGENELLALTELQGVDITRLLRFPLRAPDREVRDQLLRQIQNAGVCASELYVSPLPNISGTSLDYDSRDFPGAIELAEKLITVPLHAEISDAKVDRIVDVLTAPSC